MKDKRLHKFIAITLCVTLLTISASRVTRVSAVGTTIAASAAAALCAVGIVYCSYMALTGASIHVPDTAENIQTWLQDMGTKVVQYPAGRAAYQELYPELIGVGDEPLTSLLDRAWTWTADKLKSWANDFSSVSVITDIASYIYTPSEIAINGFDYPYDFTFCSDTLTDGSTVISGTLESRGFSYLGSTPIIYATDYINNAWTYVLTYCDGTEYRNVMISDGRYGIQKVINGVWTNVMTIPVGAVKDNYYTYPLTDGNGVYRYYYPGIANYPAQVQPRDNSPVPVFPDLPIYVQATGELIPLEHVDGEVITNPQYPVLPPDDDNKPVIPYLKLPFDPNWIDPVTNLPTGGGNWGFNLAQLLDELEDLAGLLMEVGTIGELINQFKNLISGQSGDEYYIYYDDSTNNYYQYYTITNFGDNIYNYDIDVSEVDEHLPVDLNTIQSYTNNRYLDEVKRSAIAGSSIIRDLVVFVYDIDPSIIYIFFGSCIAILVAAFIGKWGHS